MTLRRALPLFALLSLTPVVLEPIGRAQMPDPSQMSGIPRPDPSVPPGKLVVRVIRGDFAHPMVNTDVQLSGAGGDKTAKVGADGRANFEGLALGGPYKLKATSGDQTVESREIELPAEAGVKIMLVFKPDEKAALAEHDGEARADKSLPPGAVLISVVDEQDKPLANMPVVLAHGSPQPNGQPKIEQTALTTDDKGEARYQGAGGGGSNEGFMASVKKDLLTATSKPFQLDAKAGMRVGLRATAVSHDAGQLVINRKSHIIFEVKDEGVEVLENFTIDNRAGATFDPGPTGIVFRLPSDAQGAQVVGEAVPGFTVTGLQGVLRGPVAAGETTVTIGFVLQQNEGTVELRQTLPIPMEQLMALSGTFPGMEVRGTGITKREVEQGGRAFVVINGGPVAKDGELRLALVGLPHRSPVASYFTVTVAALIALWGLWAAFAAHGGTQTDERSRLEGERRALLDELAALERGKAGTAKAEHKHARRHDELMEKLERVMRELDDYAAEA